MSGPSDEALALAAAKVLRTLDAGRADCEVQRVANAASPSDPWQDEISYEQRLATLDRVEANLRDGLPAEIIKRAEELS